MKMKKIAAFLLAFLLSFAMVGAVYAEETKVEVSTAAKLKEVLEQYSNKTTGKNLGTVIIEITAGSVIEGNFVIPQRVGTNLVIEGNGSTIKGQMQIDGDSNSTAETLTIKNLVFDATGLPESLGYVLGQSSVAGDSSSAADDSVRYPHNVTIDGCTFKGNSALPAVKVAQNTGFVTLVNCEAEGMHSLLQATSGGANPITIDSCTVTNTTDGRGVSLGNAQNVVVKNCTFDVADDKYAVRTDLNSSGSTDVTISGNTFNGGQPIVVRKVASNFSHTLTVTGNTYSQLTVEESDKVITLEDDATMNMFTGKEQAISDEENAFKTNPSEEPTPEPTPDPVPTPAPTVAPATQAVSVPTPPKTGDDSHLFVWLLLLGMSLAGLMCFGKKSYTNR